MINGKNFNKSKCWISQLSYSDGGHKHNFREELLENSSAIGIWGAGQHHAQYESAVCPGSQEGKPHSGVHQTTHNHLMKRSDYPSVLNINAASP